MFFNLQEKGVQTKLIKDHEVNLEIINYFSLFQIL